MHVIVRSLKATFITAVKRDFKIKVSILSSNLILQAAELACVLPRYHLNTIKLTDFPLEAFSAFILIWPHGNTALSVTHAQPHIPFTLSTVSYHVMMWREVKGVLLT